MTVESIEIRYRRKWAARPLGFLVALAGQLGADKPRLATRVWPLLKPEYRIGGALWTPFTDTVSFK